MAEPKKRSPAFQFYAAEYLADENVELMTLEEEGAYIRAISYCWREGSLPADMDKLSRLLKGASMAVIETVKACFKVSSKDESRLIHPRLDSERVKQANWKKKCATAGKASGKSRRAKRIDAELTLNDSSHLVEPTYELNTNSSSSSSATQEQVQKPLAKDKPSPDPRAASFREKFGNYFQTLNSAPAPWDAKEGTRLRDWLKSNPTITAEQWTRILNNRRRSPVAHGKRLSVWIDTALSWLTGPADEWGKALNAAGGKTNGKGDSNLAVLERVLNEDQNGAGADGDVPAGDTRRLNFETLLGTACKRAV